MRILFFGYCARWLGRSELHVRIARPVRLRDVVRGTRELVPLMKYRRSIMVAVNQEMSGFSARVKDGDEVAFMTAFSGGQAVRFLTRGPLSLKSVVADVADTRRGAIVTFSGCVRDTERGRRIGSITYAAYSKMAERELATVVRKARRRWGGGVAVRHRVGRVPAGAASVVIACSGKHRREAFAACQFVIDEIKSKVPIWKARYGRRT